VEAHNAIASNLADVRSRLAQAATRAGRSPSDIRLVAVSKTFPISDVLAAFAAGQRIFGENRVQEALQKIDASTDTPIEWHLIGHLQSNKAKRAASAFACIHSVDSADILRRIDGAAAESGHCPNLLVQVDIAGEPTKHGSPADSLQAIFEVAATCQAARVVGLMVLPPFLPNPEDTRPYFRQLRGIRDELASRGVPPPMLRELSMGMSHDFEVAIEEGATLVRVGTAIFGGRG
jgi:PLP dependent protein